MHVYMYVCMYVFVRQSGRGNDKKIEIWFTP